MKTRLPIVLLPLLIFAVILGSQICFIVDETKQVIITQFGEYKHTVSKPGLALKVPFIQVVHPLERRILMNDAPPGEYLTADKKRMVVDYVIRWRISDPLTFYKTVRDELRARARLDDVVSSELRRALAQRNFGEAISSEREPIMESIAKSAAKRGTQYGIDVVDVRIQRADLPSEVQQNVFTRMRAERERIAKRYRSEGEEEAAKIRANADKERTIILAGAYEEAQRLRGEGDAEATRISAEAYEQDPEFYRFLRSLEVYGEGLTQHGTVFLTTDSPLLKYFQPEIK